jgi:Arc/MetJ-type ribon-helix-helix transcriptional regulator
MKKKLSISVDERTVEHIEKKVEQGLFRNKSHFIEYAVLALMEKDTK